jgi:DNA polymerase I
MLIVPFDIDYIEYVVVDYEKTSRDHVDLTHEDVETYDPFVRAVESVLSPFGWDRTDIRQELAGTQKMDLTTYTADGNQ